MYKKCEKMERKNMYEEELNKIINESKNIIVIKVYNKLIHMEQVKGGIITSKMYLSKELGVAIQSIYVAIRILEASGYITETKYNGQTKFILHKMTKEKAVQPAENVEKAQKPQPKPVVIRKGGKMITRFEIPD